jgi:hypothetical protein
VLFRSAADAGQGADRADYYADYNQHHILSGYIISA